MKSLSADRSFVLYMDKAYGMYEVGAIYFSDYWSIIH